MIADAAAEGLRSTEGASTFAPFWEDADVMSSRQDPLLRIRNLHSPLGGPFDLDLAPGECVTIVGRSGSGKSVFLRMLADLDESSGEAVLDGRERASLSGPTWRSQVVYQAAEPGWWSDTAGAHFSPGHAGSVEELLQAFGLSRELLDAPIERLSTGERQRMALARSLAIAPRVLLLDEPTASLDQASTTLVEALLRRKLDAGIGIVWVTHSPEQARRMGQRMFEMKERRLHALDSKDAP